MILAMIGGVWLTKLIWLKPLNIEHFFERASLEMGWLNQEDERKGIFYNLLWLTSDPSAFPDLSPRALEKRASIGRKNLVFLKRYDRDRLSKEQQRSYDILLWRLKVEAASEPFLFHNYPVTHISGPVAEFPTILENWPIASERDIASYLDMISRTDALFGSVIDVLEVQKELSIITPTRILEKTMELCDSLSNTSATAHVIYRSFEQKLTDIELLDDQLKQQYLKTCASLIDETVSPAYSRLSKYLFQLSQRSLAIDGAWQLPNGAAYYRNCLLREADTSISPDSLYIMAKSQLVDLNKELVTVSHSEEGAPRHGNTRSIITSGSDSIRWEADLQSRNLALTGVWNRAGSLPSFQQALKFEAFIQGWALHQRLLLADSISSQQPIERMEVILANRYHTARMMTDIGIHHKKWLQNQAVDFLMEHSPISRKQAINEVDRIIVRPGSGCAAKVGQLKFAQVQLQVASTLGDSFELDRFLACIATLGPMPMEILEQMIVDCYPVKPSTI